MNQVAFSICEVNRQLSICWVHHINNMIADSMLSYEKQEHVS